MYAVWAMEVLSVLWRRFMMGKAFTVRVATVDIVITSFGEIILFSCLKWCCFMVKWHWLHDDQMLIFSRVIIDKLDSFFTISDYSRCLHWHLYCDQNVISPLSFQKRWKMKIWKKTVPKVPPKIWSKMKRFCVCFKFPSASCSRALHSRACGIVHD